MGEGLEQARGMGAEIISSQDFARICVLGGLAPVSREVEAALALPTVAPQVRRITGGITPEEAARIERAKDEFFVPGC